VAMNGFVGANAVSGELASVDHGTGAALWLDRHLLARSPVRSPWRVGSDSVLINAPIAEGGLCVLKAGS
jgi:hypothetical protein